jgi:hypothetical protein
MRRLLAIAGTVIAVTIALTERPAACSDPSSQTATLWPDWYYAKLRPEVREAMLQADVVAKVEVIELLPLPGWQAAHRVKARVIEAIKNIEAGQVITVETRGFSCDQYVRPERLGMQAYIVGRLRTTDAGETVFRGSWGRRGDYRLPRE